MDLKQIGIYPAQALKERRRLLHVLSTIYPVRFTDYQDANPTRLDGLLLLEEHAELMRQAAEAGIRIFVVSGTKQAGGVIPVEFGTSEALDARLRRRTIEEQRERLNVIAGLSENDEILAMTEDRPLWVRRRQGAALLDVVASAPAELAPGECLWDHLHGGRFLALLPLIHFLRELTRELAWTPPPLRANIHFDDPNLHWPSYGFIDFERLARHAREYDYHASFAMVPLDGWFAHAKVIRLFREHEDRLSLLIHGIHHLSHELAAPHAAELTQSLLAQTLCRVESFERRYGLSISRVMAPPHGVCSQEMMHAMMLLGFEAVCLGRPHPFVDWRLPSGDLDPLIGYYPAAMAVGGFPILRRNSLHHWARRSDRQGDIILQTYMDQPIILAGHHDDLAEGLEILERAARHVNSFGRVQWQSLAALGRSNYMTRREGDTLQVRMFARRIAIEIPPGIEYVLIEKGWDAENCEAEYICCDSGKKYYQPGCPVILKVPLQAVPAGPVEIFLMPAGAVDLHRPAPPPFVLWPMLRRILAETRDRLRPIFQKRLKEPAPCSHT